MAVNESDYLGPLLAAVQGGGGGISSTLSTTPYGGGSYAPDRGYDNGRGYGGSGGGMAPGSNDARNGPGPSGIGVSGAGYAEVDIDVILRGMPPERIAEIQRKMQKIGLLPENYKSFGFVEKTMRGAFGELLEVANSRDSNYMTALDTIIASSENGEGGLREARLEVARKRQSLLASFDPALRTYDRSDPASVRQTAEAAFAQALGRKPKKDELEKFVGTFLGKERGSQEAVFNKQDEMLGAQRDRQLADFDAQASGEAGTFAGEPGSESDILWQRLQKMIADAPGRITPGKRSRSYEEQVRLYNNYKAGRGPLAAKPGTSKHGDGRANDLKYENQAVKRWALQNAHKYGLSFPLLNHGEDWHIEVAGGTLPAGHSKGDGHNHGAPSGTPPGGTAPISESVTNQRQDMGAQAIEFARNSNPTETAAYDIGGQFNNLLAILSKGVI